MSEEAKQIITFLLKRSGRTALPESEFYLIMSMDLQWCSPKVAKEFVSQALKSGLLSRKDDELSPTFDTKSIEIPTGFHPDLSSSTFKDTPASSSDLLNEIISHIVQHSKKTKQNITAEIQDEAKTKKLHEPVAALMLAKRYNVDIASFLPRVKDLLFIENKE